MFESCWFFDFEELSSCSSKSHSAHLKRNQTPESCSKHPRNSSPVGQKGKSVGQERKQEACNCVPVQVYLRSHWKFWHPSQGYDRGFLPIWCCVSTALKGQYPQHIERHCKSVMSCAKVAFTSRIAGTLLLLGLIITPLYAGKEGTDSFWLSCIILGPAGSSLCCCKRPLHSWSLQRPALCAGYAYSCSPSPHPSWESDQATCGQLVAQSRGHGGSLCSMKEYLK